MKKYLKQLLIIMIMLNTALCYAQDEMQGYFQTPNTSSLGVFGQIPVSLFTGVPQINIPLYTLEQDGITVPISLDYHTSLLKPNHHPSWVGLGWNLTVGGTITRIIKGQRDEADSYPSDRIYNNHYSLLDRTDWITHDYSLPSVYTQYDLEPDEFVFNFGNYTGSFFKNHKGNWQVRSSSSVKITAQIQSYPQITTDYSINGTIVHNTFYYYASYYEFTVITEDGSQYIFGGEGNSLEGHHDIMHREGNNDDGIIYTGHIDTWLLRKIITPNKQEINFEYKRDGITNIQTTTYETVGTYLDYDFCEQAPSLSDCAWGTIISGYGGKKDHVTLQTPAYLKSISSEHYKIDFFSSESNQLNYPITANTTITPNSKWMELDSIQIKRYNDTVIKRVKFNYTNNNTERLKLLSITELGSQYSANDPVHVFSYNTSKMLSTYNTNKIDHWGYYNGVDYLLNNVEISRSVINEVCLKAEILEKITYPTGGSAIFEYEPHQYRSYVNKPNFNVAQEASNILTGGLRIKKIKLLDSNQSILKETEYLYVKNYTSSGTVSSGILAGKPVYMDMFQYSNNPISYFISFTDKNPAPLSFTNGSHITYSEVVEKTAENGYIIHTFTNFDTHDMYKDKKWLLNGNYYFLTYKDFPFSSLAYIRGKSLKDIVYSEDNKLLKEVIYEYSQINEDDYVRTFPLTEYGALVIRIPYKIYTGKHNLIKQTVKTYNLDNADLTATEQIYTYNDKNLLSQTSVLGSDGKKQTTKMVYPFEIIEGPDTAVLRKMTEKNMLSSHIEKISYLENGKVIDGEYRKYNETSPNSGIFKPEKIYLLPKTGSTTVGNLYPVSGKDINFYLESGMHPPEIIRMTDTFTVKKYPSKVIINMSLCQEPQYIGYFPISICFVISIKKSGGGTPYYVEAADNIYGRFANNMYYYDRTDTLELQPGTYIVDFTHRGRFNTDFTHLNVGHLGSLNVSFSEKSTSMSSNYSLFKPEMSYRYDSKGNIIEAKHEGNQISTVYLWGYSHQYPIAEIKNATYEQVKSVLGQTLIDRVANANTPSNADWDAINSLRNTAVFPNIEITTYTYKPLIGIETVIDPSGNKVTYEYDAFGRLERIRDADGNVLENTEYHYNN